MRKLPFEIASLLFQYKTGMLTEEAERKQLEEWLSESPKHEELFRKVTSPGAPDDFRKLADEFDADEGWEHFRKMKRDRDRKRLFAPFRKYAAAIAIILSISVGGFYYWYTTEVQKTESEPIARSSITPGKFKAVLTLHSGDKIHLEENGELTADAISAYDVNSDQASTAQSYSEIETPKGGEYRLTLSDGTTVCLNSETMLRFPDRFKQENREIELLQGEIFIDVKPFEGKPFFVKTAQMAVRVVGTSFNLSIYDHLYQTTLVTGAVEISIGDDKSYQLNPSEQLSFYAGNHQVDVKTVDTDNYTSWAEGRFVFKDEEIESILHKLSRWYNFDYTFDQDHLKKYRFGINVDKYEHIEPVLKVLESTGKLRFTIEGNNIRIEEGSY